MTHERSTAENIAAQLLAAAETDDVNAELALDAVDVIFHACVEIDRMRSKVADLESHLSNTRAEVQRLQRHEVY